MPKCLVTMEAEGIAYPFFIEAPEQGRAIASIKRYWERQGWGEYDIPTHDLGYVCGQIPLAETRGDTQAAARIPGCLGLDHLKRAGSPVTYWGIGRPATDRRSCPSCLFRLRSTPRRC